MRTCTVPTPQHGGANCVGSSLRTCDTGNTCPVAVDGYLSDWGECSGESDNCGSDGFFTGTQARVCIPPQNGGSPCPNGPLSQSCTTTISCEQESAGNKNDNSSSSSDLLILIAAGVGGVLVLALIVMIIIRRRGSSSKMDLTRDAYVERRKSLTEFAAPIAVVVPVSKSQSRAPQWKPKPRAPVPRSKPKPRVPVPRSKPKKARAPKPLSKPKPRPPIPRSNKPRPKPRPKPQKKIIRAGCRVQAKHGYTAARPDELTFKRGEILQVISVQTDGWCYGMSNRTWKKGVFPKNFVSCL
jgi:hypothetical protein